MKQIKISRCLMAVVLAAALLLCATPVAAESEGGLTFSVTERYTLQQPLAQVPVTFEATVKLPSYLAKNQSGGMIFSNYERTKVVDSMIFEVATGGKPCLALYKGSEAQRCVFDKINLFNDEWTHIAIVLKSENNSALCYINGKLEQAQTLRVPQGMSVGKTAHVGGDLQSSNYSAFRGVLRNLALYSDARTTEEIKADAKGTLDKDGLLVGYDFSKATDKTKTFSDLSGGKNDISYIGMSEFFTDKQAVKNYDFSLCVVGDIQRINNFYPEQVDTLYDWIVDNAKSKKMKMVMGLGDMTDTNRDVEWQKAKTNIQKMDGVVPYSLVRGNHDGVDKYNTYFPYAQYSNMLGGAYEENLLNTWQEFTAGNIKYLVVNLDYGPSDDVLKWAGEVIEAHPDHRVIITTHCYLFRDGTTMDAGDATPPTLTGGVNNGDDLWNKLVKKHKNIQLVLSGHDPCDDVVVTKVKGDHGNVTSMLINPQGTDDMYAGTGMVAMLYFSEGGNTVEIEYYSTVKKMYFRRSNQKTVDLTVLDPQPQEQPSDSAPTPQTSSSVPNISDGQQNASQSDQSDGKNDGFSMLVIGIAAGAVVLLAAVVSVVLLCRKKKALQTEQEQQET